MFKPQLITLMTLMIWPLPEGYSAEKTGVYGEIKEVKGSKSDEGSEETLKKLLTVKGVPEQYEKCQKTLSGDDKLEKMPGCIWGGLSEDTKKQVQLMYAQEQKASMGRSPASDQTKDSSYLTNKSKTIAEDYMSDPAVVELSKIMQNKLKEALLGDEKAQSDKKTVAIVDHAKFIELYQTELGKTIVNAFTSYCIEADFSKDLESSSLKNCKDKDGNQLPCKLIILSKEDEKKDKIEKNIESLKTANLKTGTEDNPNSDSNKWTGCIGSVSNVCYTDSGDFKGKGLAADQISRSVNRACTIMDYVKSARKNLIAAENQVKYYESLGSSVSMKVENRRAVANTEKNSNDAVTTVTSKDIEISYKGKSEELENEMKKCFDNGEVKDQEECKKFISMDTDTKSKELAEFGIRQLALEDKIKEKLTDKKEVEKYLIEEGYSKDKIDQIIASDSDLEKVKQEISARYKSEREAIIASMAQKIKSQTTEENGKIDTSTGSKDHEKLKKIKNELSERTGDLKNLVHFNNIVSSYLEISSKDKKSRNVASLFAELDGGDKSFDTKTIKENAEKAGLNADKKSVGTNLGVETLNGIFKYITEK